MNTGIGVSSCMRTMYLSLILLAFITHINSQTPQTRFNVGNCPPIRAEDLGRTDILSTEGVVASVLRARFHRIPHKVQILDHQMVCQAAGLIKGTVSAISVVVRYQCEGEHCRDTSEIFVEYLNLDCNKSPPSFLLPSPTVQRGAELSPGNPSDLSLPLNTMCGECSQSARVPGHCASCHPSCNEGQRRCVGIGSDQCCNWYLDNKCAATCPSPLVGDNNTFDCGCQGLSLDNGAIRYSNMYAVGSVATHICDVSNGYELVDSSDNTRTCTMNGWSNPNITCKKNINFTSSDQEESIHDTSGTSSQLNHGVIGVLIGLLVLCIIMLEVGICIGAIGYRCWVARKNKKNMNDLDLTDKCSQSAENITISVPDFNPSGNATNLSVSDFNPSVNETNLSVSDFNPSVHSLRDNLLVVEDVCLAMPTVSPTVQTSSPTLQEGAWPDDPTVQEGAWSKDLTVQEGTRPKDLTLQEGTWPEDGGDPVYDDVIAEQKEIILTKNVAYAAPSKEVDSPTLSYNVAYVSSTEPHTPTLSYNVAYGPSTEAHTPALPDSGDDPDYKNVF